MIHNFREFLSEASVKHVFHGTNIDFKKINSKYFMIDTADVQEGVGLYFGDLKTAKRYGKFIKSIGINPKDFVDSQAPVSKLSRSKVISFLKILQKLDATAMFYLVTDYGIYAEVPSDIKSFMFDDLYELMKTTQLRNFQIEIAQNFNAEQLTVAWNKTFPKIHGLKNTEYNFYILINTTYEIKDV